MNMISKGILHKLSLLPPFQLYRSRFIVQRSSNSMPLFICNRNDSPLIAYKTHVTYVKLFQYNICFHISTILPRARFEAVFLSKMLCCGNIQHRTPFPCITKDLAQTCRIAADLLAGQVSSTLSKLDQHERKAVTAVVSGQAFVVELTMTN